MPNALLALGRTDLTFAYDRFRYRKMVNGSVLQELQGELSDDAVAMIRAQILETFKFDPKAEHVRDAVTQLCLENSFHPVREMLDTLLWDGVPRLDKWLVTYLGADDTPLNQAIGPIVLIAAVRRVRQPGVKFDQILILEGPQGSGKSSALRIIAGDGLHSDQEILTQEARAQMELMEGIWIYELGEVEGFSRAEVNKIKAFASRQEDRSRMAYGRFVDSRPRQAIFVGTTNETTYLRDQTGNRRFWPVKTTKIDLAALQRDRDQLLAEAAVREARGESIVLPNELWEAAAVEQAERLEEDPWMEMLAKVNGVAAGNVVRVETNYLLGTALDVDLERRHQGHAKRVATLMRKLGWTPTKFRAGDSYCSRLRAPKTPRPRGRRPELSPWLQQAEILAVALWHVWRVPGTGPAAGRRGGGQQRRRRRAGCGVPHQRHTGHAGVFLGRHRNLTVAHGWRSSGPVGGCVGGGTPGGDRNFGPTFVVGSLEASGAAVLCCVLALELGQLASHPVCGSQFPSRGFPKAARLRFQPQWA